MTPVLANETISPVEAPVVPVNEPVAAELPPPLPQLESGEISAVLVPPITQELMADPAIDNLVSSFPKIMEMGLGVYETADLSTVIYNSDLVSEEQLREAEQNGTLAQIAQPLGSISGQGGASPLPGADMAPLAAEQAPSPAGEPRLQSARVQNMAPRQISPIQPRPVTTALGKRAF